jgi:hypothetical protein
MAAWLPALGIGLATSVAAPFIRDAASKLWEGIVGGKSFDEVAGGRDNGTNIINPDTGGTLGGKSKKFNIIPKYRGGPLPKIGPWYDTAFPKNIPDATPGSEFFTKAFSKPSPVMETSGEKGERDKKESEISISAAPIPSSSGSTRGGGVSSTIDGGDLGEFNFAAAPGINPVSLPPRSASFDPGFKSLDVSSGLSQGGSTSRYTPQTSMNPTLQRILARYRKDRMG